MNFQNQHPNIYPPANHNPTQWKFKVKLSNCQIWENLYDHSIAEAYLLPASYLQKEQQNYLKRKGPGIVNCAGFLYLNHNLTGDGDAYVLIERITNRLSNVSILTQAQSLKVLYSVYKTLEEVEESWDEFWLRENCICFNTQGDVKIWKNPDLWNNYSESTLLKGNKCKEKTEQIIRRIFRIVEEKCINPKILKPFIFLSNEGITLEDAYSTASKIAQNLFIDIGVKELRIEKSISFYNQSRGGQLSPHRNLSGYEKKRILTEESASNDQRFAFWQTSPSFQKSKLKDSIKTQRKTISSNTSPLKQNHNNYELRSRGFSNYDPIRIQDSQWNRTQNKGYTSSPSSPKKQAFKKKNLQESQEKTYQAFEQSINNFLNKNQQTIQKVKGDFQTFGILEESKEQSQIYQPDYREILTPLDEKKKSLFDVAEMEQQLIKFSEKKEKERQKIISKKKRPSLENVTENLDPTKSYRFTSSTSGFFQNNIRESQKDTEIYPTQEKMAIKKDFGSFGSVHQNNTNCKNKNKSKGENGKVPMYMKHMRYVSDISNSSEKEQNYHIEGKGKVAERSSIPVHKKSQKENVIF